LKRLPFIFFFFIIQLLNTNLFSQAVPQAVENKGIYDFLDELANKQIIEINSAIKPYSRLFIGQCLEEADGKREELNKRQQKELDFYLMDFGKEIERRSTLDARRKEEEGKGRTTPAFAKATADKARLTGKETQGRNGAKAQWLKGEKDVRRFDMFYYEDSIFSLTVNPIIGGELFSNSAGKATYYRNGAEARGYIRHWGFYASLRDNHEKPLLGKPEYLTQRIDGHIKNSNDWSEMRGGVTFSWKWGDAGLVKDNLQWGNNYNGANIFGGNNPTFVQLKLHLTPVKWFEFNYFHGWLNSMVVDSASSYWVTNSYGTRYREVYHKKCIAANMFTFIPFKNLYLSAGNSIVYSDENANPAYLIPLFFYKSVDHSLSSGIDNMNSQMFFDISSRQIKNVHLYATWFIDELSVSRFTKKDQWNFFSYKAGFRLTDLPFSNLSFTTEFTYTYPLTYQHYVPTLTFENAGYNLGYYLRDNSREWYIAFDYQPLRTLDINLFYTDAIRGPDYTALGTNRVGNPPLASVEWHNTSYGIKASYQVINDFYTWLAFTYSYIRGNEDWSPGYFYGKKNSLNMGVTFGF
jgi:hypothetical protein